MTHLMLAWVTMLAVVAADVEAVDGDTIIIRARPHGHDARGESWRLTGFDTPETRYARCAREWMLGITAKRRLERLIAEAGKVEIAARRGKDKYKRRLGALLIDGEDAADIMVREGLARRYTGRGKRQGWCSGEWVR